MNRLRILKQRIRRAGDVGIAKMSGGFVVISDRFQGDCSPVLSKRQAILLGTRWAMPSGPSALVVSQAHLETTIKTWPCGRQQVSHKELPAC